MAPRRGQRAASAQSAKSDTSEQAAGTRRSGRLANKSSSSQQTAASTSTTTVAEVPMVDPSRIEKRARRSASKRSTRGRGSARRDSSPVARRTRSQSQTSQESEELTMPARKRTRGLAKEAAMAPIEEDKDAEEDETEEDEDEDEEEEVSRPASSAWPSIEDAQTAREIEIGGDDDEDEEGSVVKAEEVVEVEAETPSGSVVQDEFDVVEVVEDGEDVKHESDEEDEEEEEEDDGDTEPFSRGESQDPREMDETRALEHATIDPEAVDEDEADETEEDEQEELPPVPARSSFFASPGPLPALRYIPGWTPTRLPKDTLTPKSSRRDIANASLRAEELRERNTAMIQQLEEEARAEAAAKEADEQESRESRAADAEDESVYTSALAPAAADETQNDASESGVVLAPPATPRQGSFFATISSPVVGILRSARALFGGQRDIPASRLRPSQTLPVGRVIKRPLLNEPATPTRESAPAETSSTGVYADALKPDMAMPEAGQRAGRPQPQNEWQARLHRLRSHRLTNNEAAARREREEATKQAEREAYAAQDPGAKRKRLPMEMFQIPAPKNGSFGLADEWLDADSYDEDAEVEFSADTGEWHIVHRDDNSSPAEEAAQVSPPEAASASRPQKRARTSRSSFESAAAALATTRSAPSSFAPWHHPSRNMAVGGDPFSVQPYISPQQAQKDPQSRYLPEPRAGSKRGRDDDDDQGRDTQEDDGAAMKKARPNYNPNAPPPDAVIKYALTYDWDSDSDEEDSTAQPHSPTFREPTTPSGPSAMDAMIARKRAEAQKNAPKTPSGLRHVEKYPSETPSTAGGSILSRAQKAAAGGGLFAGSHNIFAGAHGVAKPAALSSTSFSTFSNAASGGASLFNSAPPPVASTLSAPKPATLFSESGPPDPFNTPPQLSQSKSSSLFANALSQPAAPGEPLAQKPASSFDAPKSASTIFGAPAKTQQKTARPSTGEAKSAAEDMKKDGTSAAIKIGQKTIEECSKTRLGSLFFDITDAERAEYVSADWLQQMQQQVQIQTKDLKQQCLNVPVVGF